MALIAIVVHVAVAWGDSDHGVVGSDEYFACDDESHLVPVAFVNDDFCDCEDGSDENATSACAHTPVTVSGCGAV